MTQTPLEHTVELARTYLRDFPKFFQVNFDAIGRTFELGQFGLQVLLVQVLRHLLLLTTQ